MFPICTQTALSFPNSKGLCLFPNFLKKSPAYRAHTDIHDRQKSVTERHGIPLLPPWLCYVPGVKLRYTGPHPTDEARTIVSCLRTHRIVAGLEPGSPSLKSASLPLRYRGSLSIWIERITHRLASYHTKPHTIHNWGRHCAIGL